MHFKKDSPTHSRVGGTKINFQKDAFPVISYTKDFNQTFSITVKTWFP